MLQTWNTTQPLPHLANTRSVFPNPSPDKAPNPFLRDAHPLYGGKSLTPTGLSRICLALFLLLGSLVVVDRAHAQDTAPTLPLYSKSAPPSGRRTPEQVRGDAWRDSLLKQRQTGEGCYKATYPEKTWKSVSCGKVKDIPHRNPARPPLIPLDESTSGDYIAVAANPTITSATGTFADIDNVTSVYAFGLPNEFSLQLNTSGFTSPSCNSTTTCIGALQFIYDSGGSVDLQFWMVGYLNQPGSVCPSGYNTNSPSCWKNVTSMQVPIYRLWNLEGSTMNAVAEPNGPDILTFTVPTANTLNGEMYSINFSDATIGLQNQWKWAEFNVFGEGSSVESIFNAGSLLDVYLDIVDGTGNAPTCSGYLPNQVRTQETTNLTLGPCTTYYSGRPSPGMWFVEAVPPTITGISPNNGSEDGGTSVALTGTGFSPYMQAAFGSYYVGTGTCPSTTTCTVNSPRGTGQVHIAVLNDTPNGVPGILSTTSSADLFTYESFPGGTMNPHTGPPAGGTQVVLGGHDFSTAPGGTQVSFNLNGIATPALNLACASSTSCTFTTPPFPAALDGTLVAPVTVTANGKTSPVGGFTYYVKQTPPPPPSCRICAERGQQCVMVNGKPVCKGTIQ